MKVFVGVKTYNRIKYFKDWVESFVKTIDSRNNYTVVVNDDGSCDNTRVYMKTLPTLQNVRWVLMYSDKKGTHYSTNQIFSIADRLKFDIGFMCDDDMFFLKKGWDKLYYKATTEGNIGHLSHFSTEWSRPILNLKKESLKSHCSAYDSQGAFYSFTKEVLNKIGYIDQQNFGRRGEGHRDWSVRACRAGYNETENLWDANGSEDYIKLQKREGYIRTPKYSKEVQIASTETSRKRRIMRKKNRIRVEDPTSFLNRYFEQIYCINLQKRTDRKRKCTRLFKNLKMEVKFWRAVDGSRSSEAKEILNTAKSKYQLNLGMIGCHLSHLGVYKDANKKRYERFLILEDDILPHKQIDKVLENLLEVENGWSLLYLSTCDWNWKNNKRNVKEGQPWYKGKRIDSTSGYAIKREIIKELIELFEQPVIMPCDTRLHKIHEEKECYVMYPQPFIADVRDSDLRGGRNIEEYAKKVNWNINNYQIKTK